MGVWQKAQNRAFGLNFQELSGWFSGSDNGSMGVFLKNVVPQHCALDALDAA